jgi:hypothetical protein
MLIKLFLLCILRLGCTKIVETYQDQAKYCNELLQRAKDTQVESVRNAYCVEVVEADQKAVLNTLSMYHLSFLASNNTYGTFVEVLNNSCKVPSYISTLIEWTSGLIPLTTALILYKLIEKGKDCLLSFRKRKIHHLKSDGAECKENETQKNIQSKPKKIDKPPIYPSSPSTRRDTQYIRKRKMEETKKENPRSLSATTEALISNLSPTLRKRFLNVEEP